MLGARRHYILTLNLSVCISGLWNSSTTLWRDFRMTFYVWWKRGGRIKKWFSQICGTSNHRKFHIIFFHLNSRSQYSCKQTGNGKGSHPDRYSVVMRSVCRFLRQKLSGPPYLTLTEGKSAWRSETSWSMFPWLMWYNARLTAEFLWLPQCRCWYLLGLELRADDKSRHWKKGDTRVHRTPQRPSGWLIPQLLLWLRHLLLWLQPFCSAKKKKDKVSHLFKIPNQRTADLSQGMMVDTTGQSKVESLIFLHCLSWCLSLDQY